MSNKNKLLVLVNFVHFLNNSSIFKIFMLLFLCVVGSFWDVFMSFSPINFTQMEIIEKSTIHYRVYRDRKEFVFIEANTAYEALIQSGISCPYKVEHLVYRIDGVKAAHEVRLRTENTAESQQEDQNPCNAT
jgi:hypothetical protein